MARARGANAVMALGFEDTYGGSVSGGYNKMPFASADIGEEQGLVASDTLGYGRDPQEPSDDVVDDDGDVVVNLDVRAFGQWLKLLFGAPTTAQGAAATGSYTFSAQPANNSVITVNGVAFTFKTSAGASPDIQIGTTLAETIRNAVWVLNASADVLVTPATYSADINGTQILVTYDTVGTGGNAFTIVAGSSPATHATASGATLAGGVTTGNYNHVFVAGSLSLPSAKLEIGMPDVPSYGMNFGIMANTLSIPMQRSGNLNATIGLIGQGETRSGSSGAGSPAEVVLEKFSQFSGQIGLDGVPLGNIVSGTMSVTNNLDKAEDIRADGRIDGADPGMLAVTPQVTARFAETTLLDIATAKRNVEMRYGWRSASGFTLVFIVHYARLPKPKVPIQGPGGVQATFATQATEHPTIHRTLTVILVNDVASYA